MTARLPRPKYFGGGCKADDYHKHCDNIAQIISKTENLAEINDRIKRYLVATGVIPT